MPSGPVDVPGFEESKGAEGVKPSVSGPSALLAPSDLFFTSASPDAEPRQMGSRLSGLFSLAREIAFQTLTSERLSRTMVSARGLVGAALTGLGVGRSTALDEYGQDAALGGVLRPVVDLLSFAQRYQLKRFGRGGFVKLALRTGAPIVPVAIVGAEAHRAHPRVHPGHVAGPAQGAPPRLLGIASTQSLSEDATS